MQLICTEFSNQQMIPAKYSCKGNSINPPLSITDVPQAAKSLALTVHDPDAPRGDFTHWLMWNIPADTRQIKTGKAPSQAIEGVNSAGTVGYTGPCPPSGLHHYVFSLYALDSELSPPSNANQNELLEEIHKHTIEKAELIGTFAAE